MDTAAREKEIEERMLKKKEEVQERREVRKGDDSYTRNLTLKKLIY